MTHYKAPPGARHTLVAVDAGKTKAGLAVFEVGPITPFGLLLGACTVRIQGQHDSAERMRDALLAAAVRIGAAYSIALVVEKPRKYTARRRAHADLDRLLDLVQALRDARPATFRALAPSAWKGQVPKDVHGPRILRALAPAERCLVPANEHDAVDAVGIGLYALGRSRRGAVL